LAFCYLRVLGFILSTIAYEVSSTCILNHVVVTMRCSHKMKSQMSKETEQRYFRRYAITIAGTVLLVLFFIISHDITTGHYKDVVLPNGQCISTELHRYRAAVAPIMVNGIANIAQVALLIAYLYYIYQIKKDLSDAGVSNSQHSLLHKIATAMAMQVGILFFFHMLQNVLNLFDDRLNHIIGAGSLLVQQFFLAVILLCTKKVHNLCKERFLKD